ncbi:MAG: HipA domain-containing protein [Gammaproteobacteria bacterium]|nr:HipA domain-containing protein [Gammaproteobacteria bacterium]
MKDRSAVIWTRLGPQPVKMGTLAVTDIECRFTYDEGYTDTGLRGLGLVYAPEFFTSTIVRERNEYFDLMPPLQALVPPRSEHNFQRALVLKYLKQINLDTQPGFDTDWNILIRSGHGAIGHLDVFESDEIAIQWYATPSKKGLIELDDEFGFSLKEFMAWFDDDAGILIDLLGPTPTVGGAIPKLMLSIAQSGWDGRIGLPTRFGDTDRTDIILKLENNAQYPGIIELEQLGLEVHREAGFDVPRYWPVKIKGLAALAIERFDRTRTGGTVFMESVYSVLASGSNEITNHYSTSYDHIASAIDNPYVGLVNDRAKAKHHLLERLLLAMLTGNGDLHLENLSFLEKNNETAFSPVYDPTPMRAYSIHNELTPPGMSFGHYGDMNDDGSFIDFSTALLHFSKNLGITRSILFDSIERLVKVTDDYDKRIEALSALPKENKLNLINIHLDIKNKLVSL